MKGYNGYNEQPSLCHNKRVGHGFCSLQTINTHVRILYISYNTGREQSSKRKNNTYLIDFDNLVKQVDDVFGKLGSYLSDELTRHGNDKIAFRTAIRTPDDYLVLYAVVMTETMAKVKLRINATIREMFADSKDLHYADRALNRPVKKGMNLKEKFDHSRDGCYRTQGVGGSQKGDPGKVVQAVKLLSFTSGRARVAPAAASIIEVFLLQEEGKGNDRRDLIPDLPVGGV